MNSMLAIVLVLWATVSIRFFYAKSAHKSIALTSAVLAIFSAMLIWWWYLTITDPSIVGFASLFKNHPVDAGGGVVPALTYSKFLLLAFGISCLFVFAGYFLCNRTCILDADTLRFSDIGIFYFVGICVFLVLYVAFAALSGSASKSALLILSGFLWATVYTIVKERVVPRAYAGLKSNSSRIIILLPVVIACLCLLQYVVTKRGGPFYEDAALYVFTSDTIPLVNRHAGQAFLASLIHFVVGAGPDKFTYSRALVNVWLFVSQIAMALMIWRFLVKLHVSRLGSWAGTAIVMAGNSAASLLPYILYDHDFPILMNVYTDSVIGIAGALIIFLYLLEHVRFAGMPAPVKPRSLLKTLLVPTAIMVCFNYTSELNILIVLCVVAGLGMLIPFTSRLQVHLPLPFLVVLFLVFGLSAAAGAMLGGTYSKTLASAERQAKSPLWEHESARARMTITDPKWWYLPYVLPGFRHGFGNAVQPIESVHGAKSISEDVALAVITQSQNQPMLERFSAFKSIGPARFMNLIYLFEVRMEEAVRILFFPLFGMALMGTFVFRQRFLYETGASHSPQTHLLQLRFVWLLAFFSFIPGLGGVILANAVNGDALYWKWALTRVLEIGLCLAMIAFAIGIDRIFAVFRSNKVRFVSWVVLIAFMTFSTFFRIVFFPSFNG